MLISQSIRRLGRYFARMRLVRKLYLETDRLIVFRRRPGLFEVRLPARIGVEIPYWSMSSSNTASNSAVRCRFLQLLECLQRRCGITLGQQVRTERVAAAVA